MFSIASSTKLCLLFTAMVKLERSLNLKDFLNHTVNFILLTFFCLQVLNSRTLLSDAIIGTFQVRSSSYTFS